MRIQTKLTIFLLTLSLGILAAAGIFSSISVENYLRTQLTQELTIQTNQFEYVIRTYAKNDSAHYIHLQQLARSSNLRLTLINTNGEVHFESELDSVRLPQIENHLHRPEIQEALRSGIGTNIRKSATINIEMLYLAKKVTTPFPEQSGFSDIGFVRVSMPLTQVTEIIDGIQEKIIFVSIILLVFITAITLVVAKTFAKPISEIASVAEQIRGGNFEKRIPVRSADEIGKLAENLNSMVDKLNEDITMLKKLERIRSEFLGNVSHELRTPIFAVEGLLETLLNGAIDDPTVSKDFVERALRNAKRLNALLGDLIEISHIQSGEMKMHYSMFPVNEFLIQIIADLESLAEQKNITITLNTPTPSIMAYGDKERLKHVMTNLIDNAIKYTQRGGKVVVGASSLNGEVKISVKDSGIGIATDHHSRIFERFYRVDKERSRESGGTGLGLAIVKHIIEAHESKMEIQSQVGRGSEFSFKLKTSPS